MDALSAILKILTALALLLGLAQVVSGFLGVEFLRIAPRRLKIIGAGLVALATLLGTADYLRERQARRPDPGGGNTVGEVTARGDVSITQEQIGRIEIHPGDTPAEKAEKREQAKRIVAQSVALRLRHMDDRLAALAELKRPDVVKERLAAIRERVAPALRDDDGYAKLMAEQQAASLQASFNGAPLRVEQSEALVRLLQETGVDPAAFSRFCESAARVEDGCAELVEAVRAPATIPSVSSEELRKRSQELQARKLELAIEGVKNKAQMAHIEGLLALGTLSDATAQVKQQLSALRQLSPRQPIDERQAASLLSAVMERERERVQRKGELLAEYQDAVAEALAAYAQLDRRLKIEPTDEPDKVVGKAISLRQLGRSGEAVAAFAQYGRMFRDRDPGAEQYARIAQQFTLALHRLQLQGGVYVYAVRDGRAAARAGLQVGDIVIAIDDRPVRDIVELTSALAILSAERTTLIKYLRIGREGRFEPGVARVASGPLSAGLMPI